MTDFYLIAHKVRSEPAFDIAIKQTCAVCYDNQPLDGDCLGSEPAEGCDECDGLGFWWVVPTSGHRAYPWWWTGLNLLRLMDEVDVIMSDGFDAICGSMPNGLPDHYTTRASPARQSLASLLAIPRPQLKVDRRF